MHRIIGEDRENCDIIPYFVFYCYTFYKGVGAYHVVWVYYYIIVLTILMICNESRFFYLPNVFF